LPIINNSRKNPVSGQRATTIIKTTVKRGKPMVTSLNVDTALLQEAIELEQEIAIENLVEIALRAYIQRLKQMKILELFGAIDYEESYDYKQQRNIA
jgi:hypothetical protein